MSIEIIEPGAPVFQVEGGGTLFQKLGYAAAVRAGPFVYVAGQVGIGPDGQIPDDAAAQIEHAFDRLLLILEAAGCGPSDVVELVSYHVDVEPQLADFIRIKSEKLGGHRPTWTILGVAGLARKQFLVEIKAVAYRP